MFYTFPAAHWPSLLTMNSNESTFGTIRHRIARTKAWLTRDGLLYMMFKFGQYAEKTWRWLRGFRELPKVIAGSNYRWNRIDNHGPSRCVGMTIFWRIESKVSESERSPRC